jgi:hypothetical protein
MARGARRRRQDPELLSREERAQGRPRTRARARPTTGQAAAGAHGDVCEQSARKHSHTSTAVIGCASIVGLQGGDCLDFGTGLGAGLGWRHRALPDSDKRRRDGGGCRVHHI